MAQNVIVRFVETQGYDINFDCDVVRFMATTAKGSYWADVFIEGPRSLRNDRNNFRERVVELIQAGAAPCEVQLEVTEQ